MKSLIIAPNSPSIYDLMTASDKYPDREHHPDLTFQVIANLGVLSGRLIAYLEDLASRDLVLSTDKPISISITSGFRPADVNAATKGAAKKSNHLLGNAADLSDRNGALCRLVLANLDLLQAHDLWLEDPRHTPTWIHLQTVPPRSGKRIFAPSSAKAPSPNRWNGQYDNDLDLIP